NGKFGDRWAQICEVFGMNTERITADWGTPLDTEEIRTKLEADSNKEIKAVVITHSETSAGVLNDLETINKHVKAHGEALMIVDAVTSLGAYDLPVDDWGLDVVASGSQKGYMIPPGMGFLAVSDKAWKAYETSKFPRFYMDLGKYKKSNAKNSTPFTPPINLMFGLQTALEMMQREGLENIFARHARLTQATRAGAKAMGLELLAPDDAASTAATAIKTDDAEAIRSIMSQKYDIALAGGQDHLKGKIFRVGHLGFISDRDVLMTISCLEATLTELGHSFEPKSGVKAAAAALV
ncbi:MAG: alanine--glyoxylate aminotransferase family protein, partial [Cyanobacteria bacterium J06631_2]